MVHPYSKLYHFILWNTPIPVPIEAAFKDADFSHLHDTPEQHNATNSWLDPG